MKQRKELIDKQQYRQEYLHVWKCGNVLSARHF